MREGGTISSSRKSDRILSEKLRILFWSLAKRKRLAACLASPLAPPYLLGLGSVGAFVGNPSSSLAIVVIINNIFGLYHDGNPTDWRLFLFNSPLDMFTDGEIYGIMALQKVF